MKAYVILILALAAALLAGCEKQSETDGAPGRVRLVCRPSEQIEIAAQPASGTAALAAATPSGDAFTLRITGPDYDRTWASVADFDPENEWFLPGRYTAAVAWGDPEAEGIDKPCYAGTQEFTIIPRRTVEVTVTALLANTKVRVVCTENFLAYFHGAAFRVATAAGNEFPFRFGFDGETDTADPVYVQPTSFTVAGSALKQTGTEVVFSEQSCPEARPQTLYTYRFDVSQAGQTVVHIYLDDTLSETREVDEELNDNAKPDFIR